MGCGSSNNSQANVKVNKIKVGSHDNQNDMTTPDLVAMSPEGKLPIERTISPMLISVQNKSETERLTFLKTKSDILQTSSLLHFIEPYSNNVFFFNTETQKAAKVELLNAYSFNDKFDSVHTANGIHIVGGYNANQNKYEAKNVLLDRREKILLTLKPLITARADLTLVSIGNPFGEPLKPVVNLLGSIGRHRSKTKKFPKSFTSTLSTLDKKEPKKKEVCYFVALGGLNEKGLLNSVEFYDSFNNSWVRYPPLSEKKSKVAATCFIRKSIKKMEFTPGGQTPELQLESIQNENEKEESETFESFIYVFGGCLGDKFSSSIERLHVFSPMELQPNVFEKVNLSVENNPSALSSFPESYEAGCLQISEKSILIFGGYGEELQDQTYILDAEKCMLELLDCKLEEKEQFVQRKPILNSKFEIYIIGQWYKGIHIFNISEANWKLIPEYTWIPKKRVSQKGRRHYVKLKSSPHQ